MSTPTYVNLSPDEEDILRFAIGDRIYKYDQYKYFRYFIIALLATLYFVFLSYLIHSDAGLRVRYNFGIYVLIAAVIFFILLYLTIWVIHCF